MKRIICALLITLLCFGSAACSSGSESETEASGNTATADTSAPTEAEAPGSDTGSSEKQYAGIEEYLQAEYVPATESEDSPITVDIYAEDDTLVYDYTYRQTYSEDQVETIKTNLDAQFEQNSAAYESIAADLETKINVDNPKVKLIYRNGDNTVITERTFE